MTPASRPPDPYEPGDWPQALLAIASRGEAAVLVTVVGTRGSAPRDAGAHMVVGLDGLHGTIGGGHLEYQAIAQARQWLADAAAWPARVCELALGASLGQCCGGAVHLLFEWVDALALPWLSRAQQLTHQQQPWVRIALLTGQPGGPGWRVHAGVDGPVAAGGTSEALPAPVRDAAQGLLRGVGDQALLVDEAPASDACRDTSMPRRDAQARDNQQPQLPARQWAIDAHVPNRLRVVLFGAGHVGRAIAHAAAHLPLQLSWIDSRADAFPASAAGNVQMCHSDDPVGEVGVQPAGVAYLILTHRHDLDYELTRAVLDRGDCVYLGLIGSRTKRLSFEQRLRARGCTDAQLQRITCPIGIAGIEGKEPAVIAIAVMAQLLQLGMPTSG